MDNVELKSWIEERFMDQAATLSEIKCDIKLTNQQVTSHDRWLWLLKGMGVVIVSILGFIGIKIKIIS
jgi:hypothetical protein